MSITPIVYINNFKSFFLKYIMQTKFSEIFYNAYKVVLQK